VALDGSWQRDRHRGLDAAILMTPGSGDASGHVAFHRSPPPAIPW